MGVLHFTITAAASLLLFFFLSPLLSPQLLSMGILPIKADRFQTSLMVPQLDVCKLDGSKCVTIRALLDSHYHHGTLFHQSLGQKLGSTDSATFMLAPPGKGSKNKKSRIVVEGKFSTDMEEFTLQFLANIAPLGQKIKLDFISTLKNPKVLNLQWDVLAVIGTRDYYRLEPVPNRGKLLAFRSPVLKPMPIYAGSFLLPSLEPYRALSKAKVPMPENLAGVKSYRDRLEGKFDDLRQRTMEEAVLLDSKLSKRNDANVGLITVKEVMRVRACKPGMHEHCFDDVYVMLDSGTNQNLITRELIDALGISTEGLTNDLVDERNCPEPSQPVVPRQVQYFFDAVVEINGFELIADVTSSKYIRGTEPDLVPTLIASAGGDEFAKLLKGKGSSQSSIRWDAENDQSNFHFDRPEVSILIGVGTMREMDYAIEETHWDGIYGMRYKFEGQDVGVTLAGQGEIPLAAFDQFRKRYRPLSKSKDPMPANLAGVKSYRDRLEGKFDDLRQRTMEEAVLLNAILSKRNAANVGPITVKEVMRVRACKSKRLLTAEQLEKMHEHCFDDVYVMVDSDVNQNLITRELIDALGISTEGLANDLVDEGVGHEQDQSAVTTPGRVPCFFDAVVEINGFELIADVTSSKYLRAPKPDLVPTLIADVGGDAFEKLLFKGKGSSSQSSAISIHFDEPEISILIGAGTMRMMDYAREETHWDGIYGMRYKFEGHDVGVALAGEGEIPLAAFDQFRKRAKPTP